MQKQFATAVVCALFMANATLAQTYPAKPLRFITVAAPGNDIYT